MQLLARVVGLLAVVASTSLVTRRLGTEFVDWATVLSAVALVAVLLEPGMAPVVVRRLTLDHEHAPRPSALLPVRMLLGVASLAVVVGVSVATRGIAVLPLAVLLGGQVLPRSFIFNATPWLQIDQRLHRPAILESLTAVLGFGALSVGILLDASTPVLGVLAFTGPVTVLALLMRRELQITPSRRLPSVGPQAPLVRSIVRETLPLTGALILTSAYTRTSIAFVNATEGDSTASRFFFGFLFAEQEIAIAGIVAGSVLPLLVARARTSALLADVVTQRLLVAVTAVGALIGAGLLATGVLLTRVIGGPQLEGAEKFIYLLAPLGAVVVPAMVLAYMYISIGRGRRYLYFAIGGLIGNLALNTLFTTTYGAVASARITWVTELMVLAVPLAAVMATGREGRRTGLSVLTLIASLVVASELTASAVIPAIGGCVLALVAITLVARTQLVWLVQTIGVRRRGR